jgi:ATP/maltotriose-dependent transcriptional regulator MalT
MRALRDGALLAEQTSQGPSVNLAVQALLYAGRLSEAQDAADAAVRDARERGALLAHVEASYVRALVLFARGRITEAAADAQAAVDGLDWRWHGQRHPAVAILLHCMVERGELEQAAKLIERADHELPAPAARGNVAQLQLARGRVHLRLGNYDAARREVEAAANAVRDYGYGPINPAAFPWQSLAGEIAHFSGDHERARSLMEEEVRLAQLFEVPIGLGIALRRRAITETGDQALATLYEAVDVLEGTEARLELARAHAALGSVLRRAGRRVDARSHLQTGLDLAHRGGATGLETQLREELTAVGARPRRAAVTGVESLTPTELRVAQLAAEGLSNREIAELVFVSRNTIAWHLQNIYRKLQVDSRELVKEFIKPVTE